MTYWYPKLDGVNLFVFRLGGPGLGNLMFPWARANVLASLHGGIVIYPVWPQLKIGPILRRERDLRTYGSLFVPTSDTLAGMRRTLVLLSRRRRLSEIDADRARSGDIVEVTGMRGQFASLVGHHRMLRRRFLAMVRTPPREAEIEKIATEIAIHVRLGDFSSLPSEAQSMRGRTNTRTPLHWYVKKLNDVRSFLWKDVPARIFSDGADQELAPLLTLPGVERHQSIDAASDIICMGSARALIASGSTFSMWASFLGQVPTVWFPGQLRHRLLEDDDGQCESEELAPLPISFLNYCLNAPLYRNLS